MSMRRYISTSLAWGMFVFSSLVAGADLAKANCTIHGVTLTEDQCKDYRKIEACFLENAGSRLSDACVRESGGDPDKAIIGGGWFGNWLGYAKCHEVAGALQGLIDRCLMDGLLSKELRPCSIMRMGIAEHVYAGICLNGVVISWTDPWRKGHGGMFPAGEGGHSPRHTPQPWLQKQKKPMSGE